MIKIKSKSECVGCEACQQICSHGCITMQEDNEGFLYPVVYADQCINCKLCEIVCPQLKTVEKNRFPNNSLVARSVHDERNGLSSSGGVFPAIAKYIISKGGIVFGAKFNESFEVVHGYTNSLEGLSVFYGAKYVQSRIENMFLKAKEFLKTGRFVLFSGTPCQIAGLKGFLMKDYPNLYTVDFICKGVPSPKVWSGYFNELCKVEGIDNQMIKQINYRDKMNGWENYSFKITTNGNDGYVEPKNKNLYLKGFLQGLFIRPSCYNCKIKKQYMSDVRFGDAWGMKVDEWNDNKGISVLLVNSEKGQYLIDQLQMATKEVSMGMVLTNNPSCEMSASPHINRQYFFNNLNKSTMRSISKSINVSLFKRGVNFIKKRLK